MIAETVNPRHQSEPLVPCGDGGTAFPQKPDGHINVKVEFELVKGKIPADEITKERKDTSPKKGLILPMYGAPNAVEELKHPTEDKVDSIKDALKHFKIIES